MTCARRKARADLHGQPGLSERIAIIGAGRVGSSLAAALNRAGYAVGLIIDPDAAAAERAAGKGAAAASLAALQGGDWSLLFLAVPDDAIAVVAGRLAELRLLPGGCVAAHCSGSLPAAALAMLQPQTLHLASMHPVQTFSGREDDWRRWSGIHIALEGEDQSLLRLEAMAERLGSRPFRLTAGQKPHYHMACVFLSNYLVALYDAADQLLAGLPLPGVEKRAMMAPLVESTIANVLGAGPAAALTGPISRGDVETVRGHLRALENDDSDLRELYCALARRIAALAEQDGRLTLLQREQLTGLLTTI